MNKKTYPIGIDKNGLPTKEGVYLIDGSLRNDDPMEIDVYFHPIKGLSCFTEDFGSAGAGVCDETDCHASVQCTGLTFLTRVRDLD